MKDFTKLERLPLGSIRAEGFLREQMLRGKDGMAGHLFELEPKMIAEPFLKKTEVPGWTKGEMYGWGAEISGNYWMGYIQFAWTLDDEEMKRTATDWAEAVLKTQREDGYLGTYRYDDADPYDDYNAWGTTCGMRALLAYYEVTKRQDVLDAVHRCMLWFCENWSGDRKTSFSGVMLVEAMISVYRLTGDERLVRFSEEYLEYLCAHDLYHSSYRAMLSEEYHYYSQHTAGAGQLARIPAMVYAANGRKELLEASERYLDAIRRHSMQLTGGAVSASEYLGPVGSTMETEYCCYEMYDQTYALLYAITGSTKYGDRMEELFYNGAQGARKKDEKAIAYLNSPNQIFATQKSSSGVGDMQVYAPCYPVACCPVNSVAVVPEFIRSMFLCGKDGSIVAALYGPCTMTLDGVTIREITDYPFRETVRFEIDADRAFAFRLRIPSWSRGYAITVNGESFSAPEEDGFAVVERAWRPGDAVEIAFCAEVEIIRVDDGDCAAKYPLAIRRGPLLYAYHIPERWKPVAGRPVTPLPEGWSWYHAYPDYEPANVSDFHEEIGRRREQFTWNVALDEALKPEDVTVELLPNRGYAWSEPMIRLHTHCYKAPYLCAPYASKTFEPFGQFQYVTERLPLVLEPYGCTNLRITYFPKADLRDKKQKKAKIMLDFSKTP